MIDDCVYGATLSGNAGPETLNIRLEVWWYINVHDNGKRVNATQHSFMLL